MTYVPGSGGGSGSVSTSSDVALNNVSNNEVLAYSSSVAKWVNADPNSLVASGSTSTVTVKRLTAGRTLDQTDAGAYLRMEHTSGEVIITVPHSSTWNPPVGTTVTIRRRGDGTVRISSVDTATVFLFPNPGVGTFTISATHASVTLIKIDIDGWDIEGMFV